jgi:hydrogenase expression/formation protein HypC
LLRWKDGGVVAPVPTHPAPGLTALARRARPAGAGGEEDPAMCLGVPGRIVEVDGLLATVDFWGVKRQVRLELVDEPVRPGDYILNHVGFAIRRIPEEDIEGTLELYEQLLKESGETDLMASDVRGELDAARGAPEPGKEGDIPGERRP